MLFVKNHTPFLGKLRLKFEFDPDYSSVSNGESNYLNKIHIDLIFTKLVSRITPFTNVSAFGEVTDVVDVEKVSLIEKHTGGKVSDYIQKEDDGTTRILYNSFRHPTGAYIGDIRKGWWYYTNRMIITDARPNGVAIVIKKGRYHPVDYHTLQDDIEGYLGYSHRASQLFKIGDKLFDETWTGGNSEAELASLPYNEWGDKDISTWDEAEQAAINFSKSVS